MQWLQNLFLSVVAFTTALFGGPPIDTQAPEVLQETKEVGSASVVVEQTNNFDPLTVQVGDKVGRFTVSKVGPATSAWAMGPDNLRITFTGSDRVTGVIGSHELGGHYFSPDNKNALPHVCEEGNCRRIPALLRGTLEENGLGRPDLSLGDKLPVEATIQEVDFVRYPSEPGANLTLTNIRILPYQQEVYTNNLFTFEVPFNWSNLSEQKNGTQTILCLNPKDSKEVCSGKVVYDSGQNIDEVIEYQRKSVAPQTLTQTKAPAAVDGVDARSISLSKYPYPSMYIFEKDGITYTVVFDYSYVEEFHKVIRTFRFK